MKLFSTNKIDEGALAVTEEEAAVRRPDLALGMVHGFLRHILQSVEADAKLWQRQLALTLRGADFDLRDMDDGSTVLDRLAMTGDALGEAIARNDPPGEVGQGVLPHLAAPIGALAERREAEHAGAVDEAVHAAEALDRGRHGGLGVRRGCHVAAMGERPRALGVKLGRCGAHRVLLHVEHHDGRPLRVQMGRDRLAHAAGGPGDDGGPAFESFRQRGLLGDEQARVARGMTGDLGAYLQVAVAGITRA